MTEQQPKSESEESNRMWASASFVGVLIIIGLPLWWKTTEVYRVALPYDKISAFNELPSVIASELTILANDQQTAAEVASFIQKAFQDEDILNITIKKSVLSDDLHRTLESVGDEHDILKRVAASVDLTSHNQFHLVQRRPLKQDVWLAGERVMFFKDAKASPTLVQALKQWVYQTKILQGARSEVADAARRTRFPPGAAYHVVLSVIHPRPDQLEVQFNAKDAVEGARSEVADAARRTRFPPGAAYHVVLSVIHPRPDQLEVQFNAKDAVEDYIGSFVDELSELHNFTLKSQWLYLLDFDFKAKEIKDNSEWGRHFAVRKERLHLLLTNLEERAATHVSPLPTLNLVLYAAPCKTSPLVIHDEAGNPIQSSVQAFMSPKWGGVVLASPPPAACAAAAWAPDARPLMGTFVAQLRTLLGVPDMVTAPGAFLVPLRAVAPRRWEVDALLRMRTLEQLTNAQRTLLSLAQLLARLETVPGVYLVPLRAVSPRRWEVDALLRMRTLEQLTNAQRTLLSLAQLLGEISNIVINDEVGASINAAVDSIHRANELAAQGKLLEAYRESLRAHAAAESAFMEPSLLALLYFPDDQKYAIYIPLFLPIMFPVVLSLKNLLLWLRGKPSKIKTD